MREREKEREGEGEGDSCSLKDVKLGLWYAARFAMFARKKRGGEVGGS